MSAAKRPLTAEVISDPSATGPRLTTTQATPQPPEDRRDPSASGVGRTVCVGGVWSLDPIATGKGSRDGDDQD